MNFSRIVWTNWLENWSDSTESQTNEKLTQFYSPVYKWNIFQPLQSTFSAKPFLPFLLVGLHLCMQLAIGSCDLAQPEKKVTVTKAKQK